MGGNELVLRRHRTRMHTEDAWWDDLLPLERSKVAHHMTMDTNNTLVIVDPNNNQLKCEDDMVKEDVGDDRGWRQRCVATPACQTGRSA